MGNVKFIVRGKPIGKMRHRSMVLPNGIIHNYNAKKNTDYEKNVANEYKIQCGSIYFIGALEVSISAFFDIPNAWSKAKKEQALNGEIRPETKPDCDNISKIVLDSLNKIAYDDDKQIIDLKVFKYYSNEARVEVLITGDTVMV